jgi:hypothetical protein
LGTEFSRQEGHSVFSFSDINEMPQELHFCF